MDHWKIERKRLHLQVAGTISCQIWFSNRFQEGGSFFNYVFLIGYSFAYWQAFAFVGLLYNVCLYNIGQRIKILASLLSQMHHQVKHNGDVAGLTTFHS